MGDTLLSVQDSLSPTLASSLSSSLSSMLPSGLPLALSDSLPQWLMAAPGYLPATLAWAVIGLMIGSFLNVAIYRLPVMMQRETDNFIALENDEPAPHTSRYNLIAPRSACPTCGHTLSALDNIPVLSYVWLKGRCR
jgi:leader peptidase (prepilin peptidase)/N-methyltransferase